MSGVQVPFVCYDTGSRQVLGVATVDDKGVVSIKLNDSEDFPDRYRMMLNGPGGHYSLPNASQKVEVPSE